MTSSLPLNDPERLRVLQKSRLMDSAPEAAFERLTHMATRLVDAPVALVSLVDDQRQFFKSAVGLPEPWRSERGTPLSHSFCQHVVNDGAPLVVNDAANHPRVKDNLAVSALGVAAYAGMPIKSATGQTLGSFCVIDVKPRCWTEEELTLLKELSESCATEVALREQMAAQEEYLHRFRNWILRMPVGALMCDAKMQIRHWNPAAERIFGYTALEAIGHTPAELIFAPEDREAAVQRLADMALGGQSYRKAASCVDKDGQTVECVWTTTTLQEADGVFDGFIAMIEPAGSSPGI